MQETLITAAEHLEQVLPEANILCELVDDQGFHSNKSLADLTALGIRTYLSEPDRGRRRWQGKRDARDAVYANRRRIRGKRDRRLLRRRGECLERTFAHTYDTGKLRRTYLRGHMNILKRALIHVGAFNLGLIMRQLIGVGTPRGLQGRLAALIAALLLLIRDSGRRSALIWASLASLRPGARDCHDQLCWDRWAPSATGC